MDADSLLKEAIDLIRKVEWVEGDTPIEVGECPLCASTESHWDGCPLGQFLAKVALELELEHTPFGPNWDDPKYSQPSPRDRVFKGEDSGPDWGALE